MNIHPVGRVDGAGVEIESSDMGWARITLATDNRHEPQELDAVNARALAALLIVAADECERIDERRRSKR